ncbi:MAG: Ig-like domain-containing protein, partial [Lachnospiraceae bacterium]|nr:Ig-like domain-containing protein [Lachnospiraceae bacterium]
MKSITKLTCLLLTIVLLMLTPVSVLFPNCAIQTVHAAQPRLNETSRILLKGEKFTLTVKGFNQTPVFASADPLVAKVSASGVVHAMSDGRTTITATVSGQTFRCKVTVHDTMDIIVFAGQSNMTNVGRASQAPDVKPGTAYEAIPKKKKISPLTEPFGVGQPKTKAKKSAQGATLVSAFANAYYKKTKTPILAMNTAKGGTSIGQWSASYYQDVAKAVKSMEKLLKKKGLKKGHVYMVFYQGENDAMNDIVSTVYRRHMELFMKNVQSSCDVSKCFVIRISNSMRNLETYDRIAAVQTRLCMEDFRFVGLFHREMLLIRS